MQPSSEVPFPVRLNVWTWKILRFPLTRLVLGVVLVVVAQEVGKIVVAAPLGNDRSLSKRGANSGSEK